MCISMPQQAHEGQKTTCRNHFFLSTMWVSGTELRLSGWAVETLSTLSHLTSLSKML